MQAARTVADLVLVGGGHAHVEVVKSFGMRPMPGVRLTLVARDVETPYSGMLPGMVAGHYRHEQCHIDLRPLARFASTRLIAAEAIGLDTAARYVRCRGRPPIRYDIVSFDIGSTPRASLVPGAERWLTAVKPIDRLAERWAALLDRVRTTDRPPRIAVVGGGAAGVELTLAMQHRIRQLGGAAKFALVTRGRLLPHYPEATRTIFGTTLAERGVEVHEGAAVARVEPGRLVCENGLELPFDEGLWATQTGAAPWLAETGLALDPQGFIAVDACLRSVSHPQVFAAGDVAAVLPHPRAKAGVFAVRQGQPLAANLRRALAGEPLRPFKPQRRYLSLISTGDRFAVAIRGDLVVQGRWAWRLKDWIDRRWMRRYQELPPMPGGEEEMRCGGCGAKVPAAVLARVMTRLAPAAAPEAEIALAAPDDAAVLRPPADRLLVQTVDFFRAFVDDPYLFGRIAANHALGDVFAMGAQPRTALAIAAVPPGREAIVEEDLFQMLRGGLDVLEAAGARLIGGHSAEASELALGFTINGEVAADRILRKGGLRPGDRLILTKPLGTGTLLAAAMRGEARAAWIEAALAAMQCPAARAAACLAAHGATACSDVTGFGLLGHLLEMLRASGTDAVLEPASVPALPGALSTLAAGIRSTLHPGNAAFAMVSDRPEQQLLLDPQTAGGLLAGVPADRAEACVAALRDAGYAHAALIGSVESHAGREPRVRLQDR
jgi:selenide,water dikinase